jgi:hypothetical protein
MAIEVGRAKAALREDEGRARPIARQAGYETNGGWIVPRPHASGITLRRF